MRPVCGRPTRAAVVPAGIRSQIAGDQTLERITRT
jgi:hypothetical protein